MGSGLIILIGFIISAILMLAIWLISRNVQKKHSNQVAIDNQKADIISLIEEAVSDLPPSKKSLRHPTLDAPRSRLPTWGKWIMGLVWLPFIAALIFTGLRALNKNLEAVKTNNQTQPIIINYPTTLATNIPPNTRADILRTASIPAIFSDSDLSVEYFLFFPDRLSL